MPAYGHGCGTENVSEIKSTPDAQDSSGVPHRTATRYPKMKAHDGTMRQSEHHAPCFRTFSSKLSANDATRSSISGRSLSSVAT